MSYFDTEAYIYSKLSTDSALLALVGDDTHISATHPENITVFPYIIYREDLQDDREFVDNLPVASTSMFVIDIYVKDADTYPYVKAVHTIFNADFWTCEYSADIPDPNVRVKHRNMRFKRLLFAGDIS